MELKAIRSSVVSSEYLTSANLEPDYSTQSTLETEFKRQMWLHIRKYSLLWKKQINVTWAFLFVAKNKIEGLKRAQWPALNFKKNEYSFSGY